MDYAPIFEPTRIKEPSGRNFNRSIAIFKTIGVPGLGDLEVIYDKRKKL